MLQSVKKFLKDEEGQSMVEYGITLGGIAAVSYLAVVVLGDKTGDLYAWMANHLPGGEAGEIGQVRLDRDGLVNTTLNAATGEEVFADHGNSAAANYTLNSTLGTSSYYGQGDEGWNQD